jgi:hypothetical protein
MKIRLHKSLAAQRVLAQLLPACERPSLFGVD